MGQDRMGDGIQGMGMGEEKIKTEKEKKKDKEQMPELYEVLNAKKSNFS